MPVSLKYQYIESISITIPKIKNIFQPLIIPKIINYNELYHAIIKFKKNAYFLKKINDGYKSLSRFNYNNNCKKYLNYINQC